MNTSLELPLNGFLDYLRTSGAARVDIASRHARQYGEPYSPGRDFYRRILSAIVVGRRTGDDHAACERALAEAPAARRGHYQAVVDGWLRFLPKVAGTACLPARTGRWRDDALTVRITPHLVLEHDDGRIEALLLYLKADPLPPADATAMLWLAAQAIPDTSPGATPVVVDVRRARAFHEVPDAGDYAVWLTAEAGGYAHLRDRLTSTSAV